MAAVPNTVTSAPTLCGALSDTDDIIFDGSNTFERIANDVLNDNFNTCIDLKVSDFDKHWNTYVSLTVSEGRIRLRQRNKVNIRDFVHWVRDRIRMSEYPVEKPFPTRDRDYLIERYSTHRKCMIDAEGMVNNAMSKTLTEKIKWIDWKVALINFFK